MWDGAARSLMRLKLLLLKRSVVVEDNHTSSTISKHSDAVYVEPKNKERKKERKKGSKRGNKKGKKKRRDISER